MRSVIDRLYEIPEIIKAIIKELYQDEVDHQEG